MQDEEADDFFVHVDEMLEELGASVQLDGDDERMDEEEEDFLDSFF